MKATNINVVGGKAPHHSLPPAISIQRAPSEETAKGGFKLSLLETVAADPRMKPTDLSVVLGYCSVLQWPKRLAWLSSSQARARTGLSERQINVSRRRLVERGYLVDKGKEGVNRLFELVNSRAAEMRMHVREAAEFYRNQTKDRQSTRRALSKLVPAEFAPTGYPLSQSPCECDIPAKNAGNIPSYTPQNIALKGSKDFRPFPVPASDHEAIDLVMFLLAGKSEKACLLLFDTLRARLMDGDLTRAEVDQLLARVA